jgi:hypothetical protein
VAACITFISFVIFLKLQGKARLVGTGHGGRDEGGTSMLASLAVNEVPVGI